MTEQPTIVQRTTLADLERICGNRQEFWSGRDYTAAGLLLEQYTCEELMTIAGRASIVCGHPTVFPIEMWSVRA